MEYLNLIRKIAWSFHQTTRLEWNDLFSKAIQSYYDALKKYDPAKSKITTYIHLYITLDLTNYIKQQKRINDSLSTLENTEVMYYLSGDDDSFFEGLSDDANVICKNIIKHSDLFIHLKATDTKFLFLIVKIMNEQHWPIQRIKAGIKEIKKYVASVV